MARFFRRATPSKPEATLAAERSRGVDFGWRVHHAQESWANKADVKASIVLALEGGAVFAAISANSAGGILSTLDHWQHIAALTGTALLFLAIMAGVVSVYPRLPRHISNEDTKHLYMIYFGHIGQWEPSDLTASLKNLTLDEELDALGKQLVEISRSNYSKLRWLQLSLILASLGMLTIFSAATLVLLGPDVNAAPKREGRSSARSGRRKLERAPSRNRRISGEQKANLSESRSQLLQMRDAGREKSRQTFFRDDFGVTSQQPIEAQNVFGKQVVGRKG